MHTSHVQIVTIKEKEVDVAKLFSMGGQMVKRKLQFIIKRTTCESPVS